MPIAASLADQYSSLTLLRERRTDCRAAGLQGYMLAEGAEDVAEK